MNNDSTIPSPLGPVDTMPSQLGPAEGLPRHRRRAPERRLPRTLWLVVLAVLAFLLAQSLIG